MANVENNQQKKREENPGKIAHKQERILGESDRLWEFPVASGKYGMFELWQYIFLFVV